MPKRICIDPGHGGYDPGAVAKGVREKDITLKIGLQLRDLLRKAGFEVLMTREADVSPGGYPQVAADLRERCRIANTKQVDVFLSLHVNAGGGRGAEIYVYGQGGPIASLAKGVITGVSTICGTHGQAVRDGGPNGTGFAVICNTEADAMLLEIGFIDSDDLQKIQANLDKFAPLICRAFCEFYKLKVPDDRADDQEPPVPQMLDRQAVDLVIAQLGALTKTGTDEVLVACNYAANSLRRALSLPITQNKGIPTPRAADRVIDVLGALWMCAEDEDIQDAYHYAADALRAVQSQRFIG
ncbi:N-acetylmuramoyl-L-alanine amidase [Tumebacillus sp. BK434]|uniref:N-acetylmuramoyl-L-alanine amidase family protein n=1 Tax=Tumebacillus sp. BK434 TaxID=2512169 RepID=UPI001051C3A4|nr:N-acetylmuramoyl-L-alanine amidase [Tumebacillus sp. BK434]TCP53423.1 N-acetylmuramoyl-L-alanine amidase [Tumebacillus sp. BK434]